MPSLRFGDRLCDWMVFSVAGWTLACNAIVLVGGGLHALLWLSLAAMILVSVARFSLKLRGSSDGAAAVSESIGTEEVDARPPTDLSIETRAFGVVASLLIVAAAVYGLDFRLVWFLAVALLGFALTRVHQVAAPNAPEERGSWQLTTWLLAAIGALLPLFVHRRSLDDTYYVNVAVAAVDSPLEPLLRFDTLHGLAELPTMFPVYQLNSYELLAAAVSYLSPLTAIEAAHWILPPVFGGFVVLAHARLMRLLSPKLWLPALLVIMAIFLMVGETSSFYSNFAFVRIHQGKCVFLSVLVPLLIVYALRFAGSPSRRGWLLLAAAHIASLGLTSTAIWVAPATATLALAARLPFDLRGIRVLGIGFLASLYPLAAGLGFRAEQASTLGSFRLFPDVEAMLRFGSKEILGDGPIALLCWVLILSSWCFGRSALSRRLSVVFGLGFLVVLFNPFLATPLADWVTGQITHYRGFWVLPLPAWLAMLATAPLGLRAALAPPALRIGAALVATGALVFLAPSHPLLSERNHVRFQPLGLKVSIPEYDVAGMIAKHAAPQSWVLAPEDVSGWIVTFHDHPYPLMPREVYLELMQNGFSPDEKRRRRLLTKYVGGEHFYDHGPAYLQRAVGLYDLGAVVVRSSTWSDKIHQTLSEMGYRQRYADEVYSVWLREERNRRRERETSAVIRRSRERSTR